MAIIATAKVYGIHDGPPIAYATSNDIAGAGEWCSPLSGVAPATWGQNARTSSTSSGPELGSVVPPARIAPRSWLTSQIPTAVTMARSSVARAARGGSNTPMATTPSTIDKMIEKASPWFANAEATWRFTEANQRGSPAAIALIISDGPFGLRFTPT